MANIHLTLAINDYDHVRDLVSGEVQAGGIDLTCLTLTVEEIFYRFLHGLEWDVSELSMGMCCSAISRGDAPFVAIPVFPSRVFRLSSIYVRPDGPVKAPEDLAGKRVGVPEWGQTAGIYTRGWLMHQVGIPLGDVDWYQTGANQPGRVEAATLKLPDGVSLTRVSDRSLTEMLFDGDIEAIFSARAPDAFLAGDPRMVRLIPDFRAAEQAYFEDTSIFPIMHTVAIQRRVYEEHPWVAMNLYKAFDEARRRGVRRIMDVTASQIAVPWGFHDAADVGRLVFGDGEYWPYGIEPNRVTLDAFLQFCFEQGVCHQRLTPEDLFPKEVQTFFKE
jgi:4,5-dihydroxyphthalate decarboxylase